MFQAAPIARFNWHTRNNAKNKKTRQRITALCGRICLMVARLTRGYLRAAWEWLMWKLNVPAKRGRQDEDGDQ